MPAIAVGAMIVGGGIQAYGAIKSAQDQADLDAKRAQVAEQQAGEIAAREASNEAIRDQVATRAKLQFGAAYAATGKAGMGVGSQLQIQAQADLQNVISAKEAKFQEDMLHEQAGIDSTLADQTREAGYLNAAGGILGGLGRAAAVGFGGGNNPGYGGTASLGPYPSADSYTMPALGAGRFGGGS